MKEISSYFLWVNFGYVSIALDINRKHTLHINRFC